MALIKKPTPSQDRHAEIQACLRKGDYKGALAAFEALLKAGSGQGQSQMRMRYGDTLVLAGRKTDAIREYLRVAEEMAETGYLVQAVAIYKKIVKLDPRQTGVVEKLARLDAERSQASRPAARPATAMGGIEIAPEEEGGFELDIGAQMGFGGAAPAPVAAAKPSPVATPVAAAKPAPTPVAAPKAAPVTTPAPTPVATTKPAPVIRPTSPTPVAAAKPAPARVETRVEPDLDLSPDDIGADLTDLAPPDISLEAPELPPEGLDFGHPASPAPAAKAPAGFDFGVPSPPPAASVAASFDFGVPSPAPGGAPAATVPAASAAAAGFDFGLPASPATAPEPPGAGLDFSLTAPDSAPAEVTPGAPESADFGLASGEETPGGFSLGGDDGDNLLGLGSDDIDAMLDGIIRDVGSDEAGGPAALETADSNIPLFSHLAVDEYVEMLKLLSWRIVKEGDVIVRQGEPGHSLFIISNGRVEAAIERAGSRAVVATMKEGDFFGEIAVLSGGPRTATVTALEATELLELDRGKLDEVFSRFPGIEAKLRLSHEERVMKSSGL